MKLDITINYAPEGDTEEYKKWCSDNGFFYMETPFKFRKAWSDEFNAYVGAAIGIATTKAGERFLIHREDLK